MSKRKIIIDKQKFLSLLDTIELSEFNTNYILDSLNDSEIDEKEIVKPYFNKLKEKVRTNQIFIAMDYDKGLVEGTDYMLKLINNTLIEGEKEDDKYCRY